MEAFLLAVLRFFVGTIFLLSGVAKLREGEKMSEIVADYELLPPSLVAPVARLLPAFELLLGAALIGNFLPAISNSLASIVAFAFAAAALVNLRRGRLINCGCFGASSSEKITWATVARGLSLGVMAAAVASAQAGTVADIDWSGRTSGAVAAAFAIATVAALTYLLLVEVQQTRKAALEMVADLERADTHRSSGGAAK